MGATNPPTLKPNIQLFGEKAENATARGADAVNKAPYDPIAMEQLLKDSGGDVVSHTLPNTTAKNVKLAGLRHPKTGIVFDQRGFPIFDDIAKVEVRITGGLGNVSRETHMKAATMQLRSDIECGKVSKNIFTELQLREIHSGSKKIPEYTWHHHQDTGRMQLVLTEIHRKTGHIGGFELWGD